MRALITLIVFALTVFPSVFSGWFWPDLLKGSTFTTYSLDKSLWIEGVPPSTANLGLPSGQGGSLTIASGGTMRYGEDDDGIYLTNDGAPGATASTKLLFRSQANLNSDINRNGECYHISYKMKWVLDGTGTDGTSSGFGSIWTNFGSSMRIQNVYAWPGSVRTTSGDKFFCKVVNTQTDDARRAWGDRRDSNEAAGNNAGGGIALRYGEVYQIDIWIGRTSSSSYQIVVTINDRTIAINDGWISNAIAAGTIEWDDSLSRGVEQRLYDFSMETFASGGIGNYTPSYDESGLDPDVIVLHNAIQTPAAVAGGYGDGVWKTTVSSGTPNFRAPFRTFEEVDWAFCYHIPSDCSLEMETRKTYTLPAFNGRSVMGEWFDVGDGSFRADLYDRSKNLVIGFGWDAGTSAKSLFVYTNGKTQDTGIDVTPGHRTAITMHFADGKNAGIVAQDLSTAVNWAGTADQTNWYASIDDFTGRPTGPVRVKLTAGADDLGTRELQFQGIVLAAAWPAAVVSSFTMSDDTGQSTRTLANIPYEGQPLFGGGHLPGQRELTVPIGGSWREMGCFGRSGGAWIRRANSAAEFRQYGWGNDSWDEIHSVCHSFRWDIYDEFQNTLDASSSRQEMEAFADLLIAEVADFDTAAAKHGVLVFDPDQVPPIDENTGGGSTPDTSWNADATDVALQIKAATRAHRLAVNSGNLIIGDIFNGRTLETAQLDYYGDENIHPDADKLWHDEAWRTAVWAPVLKPVIGDGDGLKGEGFKGKGFKGD